MDKSICSFPGCGAKVLGTGLCSGHYHQRRRGDALRPILRGLTSADRFWMKVNKDGPIPTHRPGLGPCWAWTGAAGRHGYGNFGANGRTWRAHQWSYVHEVGAVPDGLMLDHLCRNRLCVRPEHLEPVTNGENVRRGLIPAIRAAQNADQSECKHGHPLSGENLYVQPKTGYRYCRTCQRRRRAEYLARKAA
mgnify:CR=1 FL=1